MAGQLDNIEDLLDKNEIPQRVTNRAVFRALQAIWCKLTDNATEQRTMMDMMSDLEHRVTRLEEMQLENPSLLYYVKKNPKGAALWLLGVLFFMTLALSFSEPLCTWVSALIP